MRKRKLLFDCNSVLNGSLISEVISASSISEAKDLFFQQFSILPQKISGPFRKTKFIEQEEKIRKEFKFSDYKSRKAIYNNWIVNSFLLKEPENHAYLIFIERIDYKNSRIPYPKGIIVPIDNLIFKE